MKKGLVLIIAFLFVFSGTAIGFDETEIINKIDQSVLETTDGVWSGPFKARSLWSDMSSGGKESVGVTLNTGQRLVCLLLKAIGYQCSRRSLPAKTFGFTGSAASPSFSAQAPGRPDNPT